MSKTLAAGGEELRLSVESFLTATGGAADMYLPLVVMATGATESVSIELMRERVKQVEVEERMSLARAFAEQIRETPGVVDVIAVSVVPDLLVAVMLRELDLALELRFQAALLGLTRQSRDPAVGDVVVLVEGEDDRPAGESLIR